eukprot:m51a1_g11019 putative flowering time control protein fpa (665) ;mRNA; f:398106-400423
MSEDKGAQPIAPDGSGAPAPPGAPGAPGAPGQQGWDPAWYQYYYGAMMDPAQMAAYWQQQQQAGAQAGGGMPGEQGEQHHEGQQDPAAAYAQYYGAMGAYAAGGSMPIMVVKPEERQPSRTLWVGSLPPNVADEEIYEMFGKYGHIDNIRQLQGKNCCFVRYDDIASSTTAKNALQGAMMRGQTIKVSWGKADPVEDRGPPPCKNLWVGGIHPDTSDIEVREVFRPCHGVERVRVLAHKGCAFVTFKTIEDATEARSRMSGKIIHGQPIRVNYGRDNQNWNGGFGGGGGGGYPSHQQEHQEHPQMPQEHQHAVIVPLTSSQHSSLLPPDVDLPSCFLVPEELPPRPAPPPPGEAKDVVDKFVDFLLRNGRDFEYTSRKRQMETGNTKLSFLVPGDAGHDYYKFRVWEMWNQTNPEAANSVLAAITQARSSGGDHWGQQQQQQQQPPQQSQQYQQQQQQPQQATRGGRLSGEELTELEAKLEALTPTKDSIKGAKDWVMARSDKTADIAHTIRGFVERAQSFDQRLTCVYLINDVLHAALRRRQQGEQSDEVSAAFQEALPAIAYHTLRGVVSPARDKATKVFQLWADKGIYPKQFTATLDGTQQQQQQAPSMEDAIQRGLENFGSGGKRQYPDDDSRGRDYDRDRDRGDRHHEEEPYQKRERRW